VKRSRRLARELCLLVNRQIARHAVLASEGREVPKIRREEIAIGRRRFVLISFRRGRWELYRCEPDGLELFAGYVPEALASALAEGS
jgi:hypothetical protein